MISLEKISEALLVKESEAKLISSIKEISRNLTTDREQIEKYTLDERLVSAYTSFYLPTNIPKFSFLMNQIDPKIKEAISTTNFIDMGSGPATYSLALLEEFPEFDRKLVLIDQSKLMLSQAKKLLATIFPENKNVFFQANLEKVAGDSTLFFGHSINEMGAEKALEQIKFQDPSFVVMIEPGTKDSFEKVLELRNKLIEDYDIVYPCSEPLACPMGLGDWCHQVLRMTHDPSLERISQMVSLNRRVQPMIGHVYVKKNKLEFNAPRAQMVRFLSDSKHAFFWEVCLEVEGELVKKKFEISKSKLSKDEIKGLKEFSVGQKFDFEVVKQLGDGSLRVKLK